MRRSQTLLAGLLLVLLGLGALPGVAVAAPAPGPVAAPVPAALAARTDALIFTTPMPEFQRRRAAAAPGDGLDWSSDGCSVPLLSEPQRSMPHGFDFRAACERHDFGYRNLRPQGRLTEDVRRRVDDGFRADMAAVCAQRTAWFGLQEALCRRIADDYHFWVRSCGAHPAPYCPLEARRTFDRYIER